MDNKFEPFIGPEKKLPELTLKAVVLGILLTVLLCASNAYLGLKVGATVSASIPAAIIAMAVLRWFKNSNVLENNIVQTMASVGEAVVAGVAFITPAMLILNLWHGFDFGKVFVLTVLGGFLGVVTTVLIRRVMMDHKDLRFPEGTAIAEVLKASAETASNAKPLVMGGLVGALISFLQDGFRVLSDATSVWFHKAGSLFGFGFGFSPALLGAGYIIGPAVAVSMFMGMLIGWIIGVPLVGYMFGVPHGMDTVTAAGMLWSDHIRYIGVGEMLVGGLWTLISLVGPIFKGIFLSIKASKGLDDATTLRTEQDMRLKTLALFALGVLVFGYFFFLYVFHLYVPGSSTFFTLSFCLLAIIFAMVFGFLFASLAAYFAGLVGATNCPGSGFILAGVILFSLITLLFFSFFEPAVLQSRGLHLAGFVLLVNTLLGCAIPIANDSSQDMKSGQLVGATPWKQEVVLFIGVVIAALVVGPTLELLFQAYGIGGVFPHAGMPHSQMLAAPQAAMMAAVVKGVFNHNLPWSMILVGVGVGIVAIFVNIRARQRGLSFPVLAMGLGIYLPMASSWPMVVGGILAYFSGKSLKKRVGRQAFYEDHRIRLRLHNALLIACGMVAGSSLIGVILAIPFAIEKSSDALKIVPDGFTPFASILSIVMLVLVCRWFYRTLNPRRTQ